MVHKYSILQNRFINIEHRNTAYNKKAPVSIVFIRPFLWQNFTHSNLFYDLHFSTIRLQNPDKLLNNPWSTNRLQIILWLKERAIKIWFGKQTQFTFKMYVHFEFLSINGVMIDLKDTTSFQSCHDPFIFLLFDITHFSSILTIWVSVWDIKVT